MDWIKENIMQPSFFIGIGCGAVLFYVFKSNKACDKQNNTGEKLGPYEEVEEPLDDNGNYKMVLAVRNDLKMGKGKIAAQCCHGAVAAFKQAKRWHPIALKEWEEIGQAKITVKLKNEEELKEVMQRGRELGLCISVVRDAGRTQIPSGSITVLAVGPGPENLINQVTGHLPLL